MDVTDMLKKSLAFGFGAAAYSADRLRQFTQDMVDRGEMTTEEAGKFIDEVADRADEEKKSIENWVREQVNKMIRQAGAVEAERVERLEVRMAALEKRLAELDTDVGTCSVPITEET